MRRSNAFKTRLFTSNTRSRRKKCSVIWRQTSQWSVNCFTERRELTLRKSAFKVLIAGLRERTVGNCLPADFLCIAILFLLMRVSWVRMFVPVFVRGKSSLFSVFSRTASMGSVGKPVSRVGSRNCIFCILLPLFRLLRFRFVLYGASKLLQNQSAFAWPLQQARSPSVRAHPTLNGINHKIVTWTMLACDWRPCVTSSDTLQTNFYVRPAALSQSRVWIFARLVGGVRLK